MPHDDERERGESPAIRYAAAIADAETIDWEAVQEEGEHPGLDTLRLVEMIAAAHRKVREDSTRSSVAPKASRESAPLPPGTRWGALLLRERIGGGAFGEVYRAWDPMLERDVALKLRRPERSLGPAEERQFLDEARRLARVKHPHVVTVHGADIQDGRMGIWMEHLQGTPLDSLPGALNWQEAALIGMTLCQALGAVHAVGLVHRDVKPGNVFRTASGHIVLLDMGSAADKPGRAGTDAGTVSGTPYYMAPEAWSGKATTASDVYSLGVTLFHLVSGKYPISRKAVEQLAAGYPPPKEERLSLREAAPHLPLPFVQVVERAMEVDPASRIPGVGEMEQALAAVLNIVPSPRPARPWWRRMEVLTPIAAVAAVAVWLLVTQPGGGTATPVEARLFAGLEDTGARVLAPGEAVRVGERLFLDVRTSRDTWVYVVTEDAEGRVHTLFPAADLDTKNPLRGEGTHRLPGAAGGKTKQWRVDTVGGRETILLVASNTRLEALEGELERYPAVSQAGSREESDLAQRGVGEMVDAPEGGTIPAIEEFVRAEAPDPAGVWTKRFEFRSEDAVVPPEGETP